MKKLIKIICIIVISIMLACWLILSLATLGVCKEINQTDTLKTYFKIIDYGKPNAQIYKCFIIKNGEIQDTIRILQGEGQAHRDITEDSLLVNLKLKIETDYKADIKAFQELQTKIIKEESYLEILNYLIEEKKK